MRYVVVVGTLMALCLAGFVVVETLHVPVLTDPRQVLGSGGAQRKDADRMNGAG
jgi:hypothetical protein